MPCKCDYMEPNRRERESVKVLRFLKEFGVNLDGDSLYGNVNLLDIHTKSLCLFCQAHNVSDYSLELQMWWRDHQQKDKERAEKAVRDAENAAEKKAALNKLTDHEKRLLGII